MTGESPTLRSQSEPEPPVVTCLGILVADVVVGEVCTLPPAGELVAVERIELHSGGCAANTAADLSRLGIGVSLVGKVGGDVFGGFLLDELQRAGLDTGGVRIDPSVPTSASVVLVDGDGERTLLHTTGANGALVESDLDPAVLFAGRALHVAGAGLLSGLDGDPLGRVLSQARERGLLTSMDTAWDASGRWERVHAALPDLDVFMPNLSEARAITGMREPDEIAAWLRARGVERVALTMGDGGCYGASDEFEGAIRPPSVAAIDATGAGDAFAAGLLFGLLRGASFERALRLGCAAGALTTTAIGAEHPGLSLATLESTERSAA